MHSVFQSQTLVRTFIVLPHPNELTLSSQIASFILIIIDLLYIKEYRSFHFGIAKMPTNKATNSSQRSENCFVVPDRLPDLSVTAIEPSLGKLFSALQQITSTSAG